MHARVAFEFADDQRQLQRDRRAIGQHCPAFEQVIAPATLQTGGQRAFERRLGFGVEQVPDRLTQQGAGIAMPEQLEPGTVDLHDDAFLHLRDRIVGAMQCGLQLLAVFLRRPQGVGKRALHAQRAQLAADDRLHMRGAGQRGGVTRAVLHVRTDHSAVDLIAQHDQRHLGGQLVANRRQRSELGVGRAYTYQ